MVNNLPHSSHPQKVLAHSHLSGGDGEDLPRMWRLRKGLVTLRKVAQGGEVMVEIGAIGSSFGAIGAIWGLDAKPFPVNTVLN